MYNKNNYIRAFLKARLKKVTKKLLRHIAQYFWKTSSCYGIEGDEITNILVRIVELLSHRRGKHSNNLWNKQLSARQTVWHSKGFIFCCCVTKNDAQSGNGCLFLALSRETRKMALEGINCRRSSVWYRVLQPNTRRSKPKTLIKLDKKENAKLNMV